MAAAASPSSRLTLNQQIIELTRQVEAPGEHPKQIARLKSLLADYLHKADFKGGKSRFFACDLKAYFQLLKNPPKEQRPVAALARKVRRAIQYLESSKAPRPPLPQTAPLPNPALAKALEEGDATSLRALSKKMNEIAPSQVQTLFDWAMSNWDLYILYEIAKCSLMTTAQIEALIEKAFIKGDFRSISYPIMLYQYEVISEETRTKIEHWMEVDSGQVYEDIVVELIRLVEAICTVKAIRKPEFAQMDLFTSRKQLEPLIQNTSRFFAISSKSKGEESIALSMWHAFLEKWQQNGDLHEMKDAVQAITQALVVPILTDPDLFRRRIEALVECSNVEGSFDELLIPELMKTLPSEVIDSLLEWADENDDERLTCFLIRHDLVNGRLEEVVLSLLEEDDFKLIAKEVIPDKLHLLSKSTQDQIHAWEQRERSKLQLQRAEPGREEKFDTTQLFRDLQSAISHSDPTEIKRLLSSREALQLEKSEFWTLITLSFDRPACLREVLSSPYLKVEQDNFLGLLFETSGSKNWEVFGSLIASTPFTRVPIEALFTLLDNLKDAPEAVTIPFQERFN